MTYNILDENLRDGGKYSIYYKYIETHVDMAEDTFMEAIRNKNHTENECWINTIYDFYKDTLLAENKRKQITRATILNDIGMTEDTIKNGIKQTVTRFDKLKQTLNLPLTCPKCGKAMKNHNLNKKMWSLHKMCFDCVIVMETELKRTGQYEEYVRNLTTRGIKTYIKELEQVMLEVAMEDSNEGFITEQGDIEKWAGKGLDNEKLIKDLQEYMQKLKDHIGE